MSCSTQVNPDLRKLKIGARVRILKGLFAGWEGTIQSFSPQDRVKLLLWLLNRDGVSVEIDLTDVVAIDD